MNIIKIKTGKGRHIQGVAIVYKPAMASTRASKRLAVSIEREPAMATPAKVAKVSESNHVSNGATPQAKDKGEVCMYVCM